MASFLPQKGKNIFLFGVSAVFMESIRVSRDSDNLYLLNWYNMANNSISSAFIALPKLWKVLRWQLCRECFSLVKHADHSLNDTSYSDMNKYRYLSVAAIRLLFITCTITILECFNHGSESSVLQCFTAQKIMTSPVPKEHEYLKWGFCRSDPLLVKA